MIYQAFEEKFKEAQQEDTYEAEIAVVESFKNRLAGAYLPMVAAEITDTVWEMARIWMCEANAFYTTEANYERIARLVRLTWDSARGVKC